MKSAVVTTPTARPASNGRTLLARARKSDSEFDQLMAKADIFIEEVPVLATIEKGVETGYDLGYVAGYTAAQSAIQESIGIPQRD